MNFSRRGLHVSKLPERNFVRRVGWGRDRYFLRNSETENRTPFMQVAKTSSELYKLLRSLLDSTSLLINYKAPTTGAVFCQWIVNLMVLYSIL